MCPMKVSDEYVLFIILSFFNRFYLLWTPPPFLNSQEKENIKEKAIIKTEIDIFHEICKRTKKKENQTDLKGNYD